MLKSGYTVILGNTDGEPEREKALIDSFLSRGVDGLIVASASTLMLYSKRCSMKKSPLLP